jgi:hypothetical protein
MVVEEEDAEELAVGLAVGPQVPRQRHGGRRGSGEEARNDQAAEPGAFDEPVRAECRGRKDNTDRAFQEECDAGE